MKKTELKKCPEWLMFADTYNCRRRFDRRRSPPAPVRRSARGRAVRHAAP